MLCVVASVPVGCNHKDDFVTYWLFVPLTASTTGTVQVLAICGGFRTHQPKNVRLSVWLGIQYILFNSVPYLVPCDKLGNHQHRLKSSSFPKSYT